MTPFPPAIHGHAFEFSALACLAVAALASVLLARRSKRLPSLFPPFLWFIAIWILTLFFPTNWVARHCELDAWFIPAAWVLGSIPILNSLRRMWRSGSRERAGVVGTLIAVWGLYQALVWPQWMGAREGPRRSRCTFNLKEIAKGFLDAEQKTGALPVPTFGDPPRSWRVDLLPYLNETALRGRYRNELYWDDLDNLPVSEVNVPTFSCPTSEIPKDSRNRWYSAYALPIGPDTLFAPNRSVMVPGRTDDKGSTILVLEACGQQIVWTEPRDVDLSALPLGMNLPGKSPGESDGVFSSYHRGGAQAALADGSVRFFSTHLDETALKQLLNTHDGIPDSF